MTATTRRQLTPEERARAAVVISLQKAGIVDENEQRHVCAVWARRPIASRTELTEEEARSLARRVKRMTRAELADVLARPVPAAEAMTVDQIEDAMDTLAEELTDPAERSMTPEELRAHKAQRVAVVCGPKPMTEGDAATVAAFAAALDDGPAAVAAFALGEPEPEPLPPIGAFHLTPDGPVPVAAAELVREAPAEPVRCVASWCEDDACTADHPEPADIEEAAEEAVRRHRERQTAGIVLTAPDLSTLPPRVPVPLGPPPGRYCLTVCYCGGCKHWTPAPPPDYSKTPGSIAYEEANRWRY